MKKIDTGRVEGHHGFPKKAEGFAGEVEGVPCGMEAYWPTR